MKKLTLLMVLVLLISCTESKEKKLVSNYEQRIGNTKTDLNLKFQKFEFVKDYIVKDSLDFLTKYLNEEKEMQIQHLNKKINRDEKTIQIIREGNFAEDTFKELTKDTYQQIENRKSMLILYNEDFRRTYLESTYIKIGILKKKLDSVLCKEYNVSYTIENPLLNNAKQTLSKTYFINSELTQILKSVALEL